MLSAKLVLQDNVSDFQQLEKETIAYSQKYAEYIDILARSLKKFSHRRYMYNSILKLFRT